MLVAENKELWERCERLKNCGRDPDGAEFEYPTIGTNARISAFQAAIGLAQLVGFEERFDQRERNWACLKEALQDVPGIELQARDERVDRHALHLLVFRYDAEAFGGLPRAKFIEAFAAEGVGAPHAGYQPIYKNPGFFADVKRMLGHLLVPDYGWLCLPNTEKVCNETSVWLRQNELLGESTSHVEQIAEAIRKIRHHAREMAGA